MDNLFSSSYDPFHQELEASAIEALNREHAEDNLSYRNKSIPRKKFLALFLFLELEEKCAKVHAWRYFTTQTSLQEEIEILEKLKKLLIHMSAKDLSNNDAFARSFSGVWQALLSMQTKYYSLKKINPQIYRDLYALIYKIHHYKIKESEHPLGHYLNAFVGQKWFPFPFIQTLRELHTEFVACQQTAPLADIIQACSKSIETIKTIC